MMQFQHKPGNNNDILFLSKFIIHDSANLNEKKRVGLFKSWTKLDKAWQQQPDRNDRQFFGELKKI